MAWMRMYTSVSFFAELNIINVLNIVWVCLRDWRFRLSLCLFLLGFYIGVKVGGGACFLRAEHFWAQASLDVLVQLQELINYKCYQSR